MDHGALNHAGLRMLGVVSTCVLLFLPLPMHSIYACRSWECLLWKQICSSWLPLLFCYCDVL
jgi:hypothetical protein